MKKEFVLLTFFLIGLSGCGDSKNGNIKGPDLGLSPGNFFDVWTLTATLVSSDCPNNNLAPKNPVEEIRIVQTESGCLIKDEDNKAVLVEEETECQINGNRLSLHQSADLSELAPEGCQFLFVSDMNLELGGDDQLKGPFQAQGKFSGNCGGKVVSCSLTSSVVGVRGRHAPKVEVGDAKPANNGGPVAEELLPEGEDLDANNNDQEVRADVGEEAAPEQGEPERDGEPAVGWGVGVKGPVVDPNLISKDWEKVRIERWWEPLPRF